MNANGLTKNINEWKKSQFTMANEKQIAMNYGTID